MALHHPHDSGDPHDIELPVRPAGPGGEPAWGSDAVVDLLRALDVPYVPMNPGSSFRGLHDSVVNHGGNRLPQLLLCLHEEIAVSMANGWSKATGRLGAAAVHDLVGLMHASMAIYDASCDHTPLLLLGGSGPADHDLRRPIDWVHSANTQAQLVREFVVWDAEPTTPQAFVDDLTRAAQRALSTPRGPAYVSLDAGVQEVRVERPIVMPDLARRAPVTRIAASVEDLDRAVNLLIAAERPVVVAGRVGLRPEATPLLVELVELLGASYHDDRNWVAMPTVHPQNCSGDARVIYEADVVLAVDVQDVNRMVAPTKGQARDPARGGSSTPMVVDLSSNELGVRSWSNALAAGIDREVHLVADPLHGLGQLLERLRPRIDPERARTLQVDAVRRAGGVRERQRALVEEHWDDRPISQSRLVAELWSAVRPIEHLLCLRNTRSWPEGLWEFAGAGCFLGGAAGGGIGYGPGALIGGALAARDRGQLGIGIIGDGDLAMAPGALWTASHYRIPLVMVVNNNGSFYNDEPHQAEVARHRGRAVENSWIGMRVDDPAISYVDVATSFGAHGIGPVTSPDDLGSAFEEAVRRASSGESVVVDVHTARG